MKKKKKDDGLFNFLSSLYKTVRAFFLVRSLAGSGERLHVTQGYSTERRKEARGRQTRLERALVLKNRVNSVEVCGYHSLWMHM